MDATHVFCPRCNSYQPMVMRNITVARPWTDGSFDKFVGMAIVCRNCDFEVTQVGCASHEHAAA